VLLSPRWVAFSRAYTRISASADGLVQGGEVTGEAVEPSLGLSTDASILGSLPISLNGVNHSIFRAPYGPSLVRRPLRCLFDTCPLLEHVASELKRHGHSYAQCEALAGLKPDKGRTAWLIVNNYEGPEA
jgi:hypothetical protein